MFVFSLPRPVLVGGLLCLFATGCARVDVRADRERVGRHLREATGASRTETADIEALLQHPLAVDDCVRIALRNNPRVEVTLQQVGIARANLVQSQLFSNPSLFFSLRMPDGGGRSNVEFNLAQNLAELWQIPIRSDAASARLNQSILQTARELTILVSNVQQQHLTLQVARERIAIGQRALDIGQQLRDLATARKQAGSGSEVDRNLADSAWLQTRVAQVNLERDAQQAEARLRALLGFDDNRTLQVPPLVPRPDAPQPLDALQQTASEARLDLQAIAAQEQAAVALLSLEQTRFLRSLQLGFAFELLERRTQNDRALLAETLYNSLQSGALTPPTLSPRTGGSTTDTIIGPTLGLELPLWDQNQAQIARAEFQLRQIQARRSARQIEIAQQLAATHAELVAANGNLRLYQGDLLPTAEAGVELARTGYRIGRVSFLSLLEAQRRQVTVLQQMLDTKAAAGRAWLELQRLTGRPHKTLARPEASS